MPKQYEARLFLAGYYRVMERLDRARQQLRMVLRADDAPRYLKLLASHNLSRIYGEAHQFARAIEIEKEVLQEATRDRHELLQVGALANVAIYSVKIGRLEDAPFVIKKFVHPNKEIFDKNISKKSTSTILINIPFIVL